MAGNEEIMLHKQTVSSQEIPEGNEETHNGKEEIPRSPLQSALERLKSFEPADERGTFVKGVMGETLKDIETTLKEGGEDDPLNLLIAYRGLEEAGRTYGNEDMGDVGIAEAMAALKEKMKAKAGFDIGEVEDLDAALEESRGRVGAILQEHPQGEVSHEQAIGYGAELGQYLALKQEIAKRQQEILGESRNFYGKFSEKIFGPLVEYLKQAGEKIDEKATVGNALLRYLGKHKVASKLARGVAMGVVSAGAIAFFLRAISSRRRSRERKPIARLPSCGKMTRDCSKY